MTPYSELFYFVLLTLMAVGLSLPWFQGRMARTWIVGATLFMLPVQYCRPLAVAPGVILWELAAVAVFGLYMLGVVRAAMGGWLPRKSGVLVPLALAPLVLSRLAPMPAGLFPGTVPEFHFGFVGLSYATFRALDVLFSVSDGTLVGVGSLDFLAFLVFFPTLSAGPVDRFRRFQAQWGTIRSRTTFWNDIDAGVALLFRGLLYKFIIATKLDQQLLDHVKKVPGMIGAIEYAYAYTAYLFFDFAGYSAFAIGVSRWFGIHTPPNFNAPFLAKNIRDFWNRWHMSLSFWFRDHVYTRFLLSAVRGKWFKKREHSARLGYFVSFGLMGVWHGFTWFYILYGLYHAALMSSLDVFTNWKRKHPGRFAGRAWDCAARLLTLHAVIFGFWLFSGHGWVSVPDPTAEDNPTIVRQEH